MRQVAIGVLAAVALAGLAVPADVQAAGTRAVVPSVARFLRARVGADRNVRYIARPFDLNRDGRNEVVVYLLGPSQCGSGGCNAYVLRSAGRSYRILAHTSVTQLPIVVLPSRSHGYYDLGVGIGGGGAKAAQVRLRFDGRRYAPANPTIARPVRDRRSQRMLIAESDAPRPLN